MDNGDDEAAAEVLTAELASPACSGFERALASHALLGILPNAADAPDLHDEMQAVFASLGIVRVPPLRSIDLSSSAATSPTSTQVLRAMTKH